MNGKPLSNFDQEKHFPSVFFDECQSGKYISRSLLVDTDNQAIDNVRSSESGSLYSLDNFCCGRKSTSGNFATGFYNSGVADELAYEKVRKL